MMMRASCCGNKPIRKASFLHVLFCVVIVFAVNHSANGFVFLLPRHQPAALVVQRERTSASSSSSSSASIITTTTMQLSSSSSSTENNASNFSSNDASSASLRRQKLKQELLQLADEFQQMRSDADRERLNQMEEQERQEMQEEMSKNYVRKLIGRIMNKVMRRRKKQKQKNAKIIKSESLGTSKLDTGKKGEEIIQIAQQLATLNPTKVPVYGWKGYGAGGGNDPSKDCKLQGRWKLRFTTAADATFAAISPTRGKAATSQEIDATVGTLTNVVDFEKGKLQGFRVVVAGDAASDTEIDLTFRRVVILRRDARFFKRLVFPIPARLFRLLNRFFASRKKTTSSSSDETTAANNVNRGPYFELKYIDDDLRMHQTGEGNWFIQSRLN